MITGSVNATSLPANLTGPDLDASTEEALRCVRENGYALIPNALTLDECHSYMSRMDRLAKSSKTYIGGYLRESNILERDISFSELLDHQKPFQSSKHY